MMADDLDMSEDGLEHEPAVDSDAYTGQAPTWQIARHPFVVQIDMIETGQLTFASTIELISCNASIKLRKCRLTISES